MPEIKIDDEVYERIKAQAEPFVDTPNSALRRILGLEGGGKKVGAKSDRAPAGSLLPESEYELPVLQVLLERGGSETAREVTEAVGKRVADRLTERDRETLDSGDVRWENRVHFTRLTLKERGLLKADSPRGVWELSEKGRRVAEDPPPDSGQPV